MDVTFVSLLIAIVSGFVLLVILCYFLYQKRKQLQHYEFEHTMKSHDPAMGDATVQARHESPHFNISSEKQEPVHTATQHASLSSSSNSNPPKSNNPFIAPVEQPTQTLTEQQATDTTAYESTSDISEHVDNTNYEPDDPFVILYLAAETERPYIGYELLQALLSAGLRYGDMNIFHRYERIHSRGTPLFSLASVAEPGTFDLNKMGEVCCNGLCLFTNLDENKEPILAFEKMLDTAHQLIDDLGGSIFDEQKQPLDHSIISNYRARIRDYVLHTQRQHVASAN